ncbi:MAG: nucleotidyltransferase family protein [Lachnospiraceae bacterium]|nr:nucleotidyltransferase family protein [Lachnospiraceae bacterium]
MDDNKLIELLHSALTGSKLNTELPADITSNTDLFNLASSHSIANVVSVGLFNNGFDVEGTPFEQAELRAAYSDAQIEAVMFSVRSAFEARRLTFIPLKGVVLKQYYPDTSMRTCGDADILVKEGQLEAAVNALVEECGYRVKSYNFHDVELITPEGQVVELHFSVLYDIEKLDAVLSRVWNYAVLVAGSECEMKLTDDFFLFFILAHMFHHFVTGGCGIRFFMDLWVIRHRMGIAYETGANEFCIRAGIDKFASAAFQLSEVWFGENCEHTELTKSMEEYILSGGTFGSAENIAASSGIVKRSDRFRYNLNRMILPYSKLKLIYPAMKPAEFPVCEIKRWGELLNKGLSRRKEMSKKAVPDEKKEKVRRLMQQLDIE